MSGVRWEHRQWGVMDLRCEVHPEKPAEWFKVIEDCSNRTHIMTRLCHACHRKVAA